MRFLLVLLLIISCGSKAGNIIVEQVGAREFFVIQGFCAGSTLTVEEDGDQVIVEMDCRPFNTTTGEFLTEMFDFEEMELPDGTPVIVMTKDEFDRLIEHYEIRKQGDNELLRMPWHDEVEEEKQEDNSNDTERSFLLA